MNVGNGVTEWKGNVSFVFICILVFICLSYEIISSMQ